MFTNLTKSIKVPLSQNAPDNLQFAFRIHNLSEFEHSSTQNLPGVRPILLST